MAYIKTDDTGRITAVTIERLDMRCYDDEIEVEIPEEIMADLPKIHEYLYKDGEFVHNPKPKPEPEPPELEPTATELINALLGVE